MTSKWSRLYLKKKKMQIHTCRESGIFSSIITDAGVDKARYTTFQQIFGGIDTFMFHGYMLDKSSAPSNNVSLFLSAPVPFPLEPEPQLGMLVLSDITPDSFNVSWTTQAGPFAKIVINVSDSHSLHEPQQFTVSGNAQHAHVTGLVESTGYDVSVAGTTWAGGSTKPLTAFVVTGTLSKALVLFGILNWGREERG